MTGRSRYEIDWDRQREVNVEVNGMNLIYNHIKYLSFKIRVFAFFLLFNNSFPFGPCNQEIFTG